MWQIINTTNWEKIRQTFAWIRDMEGIPQSPIYHAEGDVATHTKMVLNALLNMEEYQGLNEQDQQILIATALFFIWLAGRIYRVGILMYGKKVTFKELGKWLFYKD